MNRRMFLLSTVAMLTGASDQAATVPAPKSNMGLIVFYRPRRAMAAAIRFQINTSAAPVGNLANGSMVAFHTPAGSHTFSVSTPSIAGSDSITVDIAAGQTAFVRADMRAGLPAGRGKFIRMDPSTAQGEIARI